MKIISYILAIISTITQPNAIQLNNEKNLAIVLQKTMPGESIWIVGDLADSIENEIIYRLSQDFFWQEKLQNWKPLTLENYRDIVLSNGFLIMHIELHREIIGNFDVDKIPDIGLQGEDKSAFINAFLIEYARLGNCGVRKQVLMQVSNPSS